MSKMPKVYIPTAGPDDWRCFLADPTKQWRTGFSAKTLAHCWEAAGRKSASGESTNGLPSEIAAMLRPHGGNAELLLAIPEYKVALPGSSLGASQNDVFALARAGDQTFAIMVEGKVCEPFGETLGDWLRNASAGKHERLAFICGLLGLTLPLPDQTHYQLLHRAASAVIEGRRFKMIVHSFSPERTWFESFVQFGSLFDADVVANELTAVRPSATPPLYIGWACGDCNFLTA